MSGALKAYSVTVEFAGSSRKLRRPVLAKDPVSAKLMVDSSKEDTVKVATASPLDAFVLRLKDLSQPNHRDIRAFYREIKSSLSSDPSLGAAFKTILPGIENSRLAVATYNAVDLFQKSEGMDTILDSFSKVLPTEHIERIRAAHNSGDVPEVINQLAQSSEKGVKLQSKIKSSLFEPGINIVAAILCSIYLASEFLPAMTSMFASKPDEVPGVTKALLSAVDFSKAFPLPTILVTIGIILLPFSIPSLYLNSPRFQDLVDRLPYFGTLLVRLRWVKVLRTLSMLLESNLQIEKALTFTIKSVHHFRTKKFLTGIRDTISSRAIDLYSAAIVHQEKLGKIEAKWISKIPQGVKTGSIDKVLSTAANDYEERADEAMETLPKYLNLIGMVIAGTLVGFISLAAMLPTFRMYKAF